MASTPASAEQSTPAQPDTAMLAEWCKRGLSDMPYVANKEQWDELSDTAKSQIIALHPSHAEYINGNEEKLPASLRLKLQQGQLDFSDLGVLADNGFYAAAAYLQQQQQQFMQQRLDEFIEEQRTASEENTKAVQAEYERMRVDGEARFKAQQKANYLRYLNRVQPQDLPVDIEAAVG